MSKERIRDYIIEGMLGRGGMGSVYLARHIHLETKAALKVLLDQFSDNASVKARFINEAKLLHNLQHPNIVQQKEFFEDAGRLVLAMEYVDGRPLDKMIGQDVGPIPWEKALPLFTQILDGIGYAHSKGIVHRDIKPANILLTKDGKVKISDLGIAKIAGEKGMTRTGAQMGTLYYESPEQIRGAKDVDHRSDIYSLGMTLYEMLAGRLPFDTEGDTSEFEIMIGVVQRQNNLDPREHYPHIPEWLVETIQKATDLDPEQRFQSCEYFKQVIEKYGNLSATESTFWSGKVASVKSAPLTTSKPISTESAENVSMEEIPRLRSMNSEDRLRLLLSLMHFIEISEGRFMMGTPRGFMSNSSSEHPYHSAELFSFHLLSTHVTQQMWKIVMLDNPSCFKGASLPMENVSWDDSQKFIQQLNEMDIAHKYRLPTEAEWEYCCRAGTTARNYWGGNTFKKTMNLYCWYLDNSNSITHAVGLKEPNAWGFYDMIGNVWEWCQDVYSDDYVNASLDGCSFEGSGCNRVVRGGSWNDPPAFCRSAYRGHFSPEQRNSSCGFRLVRINK